MNGVNKVKINVNGSDYLIASREEEGYVKELAYQIDTQVQSMMDRNPNMSVTTGFLICALSYLDDCNKVNANCDNMRSQLKEYLENAARSRIEAENAKRDIEKLNREIIALKRELQQK